MEVNEDLESFTRRHERAVEKIKKKLFSTRSPRDYHLIEESFQVVPLIFHPLWGSLGGISYRINVPKYREVVLRVEHFENDLLLVSIENKIDGYTMRCGSVSVRMLDREVFEYVESVL